MKSISQESPLPKRDAIALVAFVWVVGLVLVGVAIAVVITVANGGQV